MVIESSVDGGSGFDVPDTPGPSAPPKAPPPSPEPEPRIINNAEGSKKQREAVKKLSTYSREVAERKAERLKSSTGAASDDAAAPSAEPGAEPNVESNEAQASSVMLTGNIIAAIGVGVAALCLYLSYTPKPALPDPPRPQPSAPKSPKATQPSRFKRL